MGLKIDFLIFYIERYLNSEILKYLSLTLPAPPSGRHLNYNYKFLINVMTSKISYEGETELKQKSYSHAHRKLGTLSSHTCSIHNCICKL